MQPSLMDHADLRMSAPRPGWACPLPSVILHPPHPSSLLPPGKYLAPGGFDDSSGPPHCMYNPGGARFLPNLWYNRFPQVWWLKTTEFYSLSSGARSPESKCRQDHAISEVSRGECLSLFFFSLPRFLGTPCIPCLVAHPCPRLHTTFSCVSTSSPLLSLI